MRTAKILAISWLLLAGTAHSGQTLQPGFYSHEPESVALRISSASSGMLCSDVGGDPAVCTVATKVLVTGQETCIGNDGAQYPCTRYGYRYDYSGAEPGGAIECRSTRRDPFRSASMDYTLDLDADSGSVFVPSWVAYESVEQRTMLTEVHECTYQGEPLTTIEYIVTYEPSMNPTPVASSGPAPGIHEPYFDEIPDSCMRPYLTEATAGRLMNAQRIQEGSANEHIVNLWSQCTYHSIGAPIKTVRFVFKFMLYELFDVDKLSTSQLRLNATFAASGNQPTQQIDDLGKVSFVFQVADSTILMVVTGIQGPPDGAGRPMEFIANYYLDDPEQSHATRLVELIEEAEEDLELWHSGDMAQIHGAP